eukprot:TRINITY_DN12703_c0_g1_i2.p1 TRINITY_DN12703_c0_g1~~TRINITY_DN12703_c0_g1_i2.p1  ORF type:complete len:543 (-),score=57.57 TRINITY_DN12703_c0_g1_i2:217-1845(-)
MGSKSSNAIGKTDLNQSFLSANSENSESENIVKLKKAIIGSRWCQCLQSDKQYQLELSKSQWYQLLLTEAKSPDLEKYTWIANIIQLINVKIQWSYHKLHQLKLKQVTQSAVTESSKQYQQHKQNLSSKIFSQNCSNSDAETKIIDQLYDKSELIDQNVAQSIRGDEQHRISMNILLKQAPLPNLNSSLIGNAVLIDEQKLKEKNKQEYQSIFYYKKVINLIEPLLKKKNLCFYHMTDQFIACLHQKYANSVNFGIDELVAEIRDFIYFFLDLLYNYFDLEHFNSQKQIGQNYISIENMYNFVLSFLHQNEIYNNLISAYLLSSEQPLQIQFVQSLKSLKNKSPQFFKIAETLQLNEVSVNLMRQKNAFIKQQNYGIPYNKAINYFKQIQNVKSPIHKLKVIVNTSRLIDQCIREFYESNQNILQKITYYDADQILSIFLYIICQSQITSLLKDLTLIEKIIHKETLNSQAGFLLTTVKGCIYHICSIYGNDDMQPYDRFSSSFRKAQSSHGSQISSDLEEDRASYQLNIKEDLSSVSIHLN